MPWITKFHGHKEFPVCQGWRSIVFHPALPNQLYGARFKIVLNVTTPTAKSWVEHGVAPCPSTKCPSGGHQMAEDNTSSSITCVNLDDICIYSCMWVTVSSLNSNFQTNSFHSFLRNQSKVNMHNHWRHQAIKRKQSRTQVLRKERAVWYFVCSLICWRAIVPVFKCTTDGQFEMALSLLGVSAP